MPKSDIKKQKTKDILLDTAEELFAKSGYDGVSVRDITEQAGTRLAAINYYFGSKNSLFVEVILRRAHILSTERLQLLDSINFEALDEEEGLSQLICAFTNPLLKRSTEGDPGWKNYCQLIAQIAALHFTFAKEIQAEFNAPALEFVKAIKRILPSLNERKAHYAFQFMLSNNLYVFTENTRIDSMTGGKFQSSDLHKITHEMIKYQVGGLISMAKNN